MRITDSNCLMCSSKTYPCSLALPSSSHATLCRSAGSPAQLSRPALAYRSPVRLSCPAVMLKLKVIPPRGRGGYSQKNWVGVCDPLLKTLTLFMTKISESPYPIYDLTKNMIPYLSPDQTFDTLLMT